MPSYQHILLAVDFTEDSHKVSSQAAEIARQNNAKLSLLHVVEAMPEHSIGYMMTPDLVEKFTTESQDLIAKIGTDLQVSKENQHIKVGSPKIEIIELAKELTADLIILGSHGRHGLAKLLGSTATAVLNEAHCDVLTVKLA